MVLATGIRHRRDRLDPRHPVGRGQPATARLGRAKRCTDDRNDGGAPGNEGLVWVMEPKRFKMMVMLSSDHAGIAKVLKRLEREIYRVVARIDDPRAVRNYLETMCEHSEQWLTTHPHYAPWDKKQ